MFENIYLFSFDGPGKLVKSNARAPRPSKLFIAFIDFALSAYFTVVEETGGELFTCSFVYYR